jgi:hypothetical protein
MSRRRSFGSTGLVLASTLVAASCSDSLTGPASAPQALTAAAPTIGLSRTTLRLCYPSRPSSTRACYSSGYVGISNTGGGTLNWTSTKNKTWLRRSPSSGTAPSTMKVSVDGTGVSPGSYYVGYIYVWATEATNSGQRITVYFTRW